MQALIISDGHLEDTFITAYIRQFPGELTIAVDSGMSYFYRKGLIPDYIVGDFDSVEPEVLHSFMDSVSGKANCNRTDAKESIRKADCKRTDAVGISGGKKPVILQFQPEKDETDTELAIRTAISEGCDTIHILGATGTRMDHMLGNIHLLGMAMEQGITCIMADAHNRIRMIKDSLVIKKEEQYGNYVSLLPFTPKVTGVTLKGFKYPLEAYTLECYHSLGVSNEIVDEQAEISFQDGVLLVVESRD